ncbi:pre-mRNA-splicing factor prp1 [Verticillium dahliae VdLs.17]|uniref:Pre-mRNA-splicing factor prp1 n=1 Tax=Verticillium dahliae (strain VdLs.17 / ATCC MYA-4575 / FGSC 10137) TaxID=498257 RepID=G2WR29_VERDV|nr:pre-mRNA-splicing factor prp1 [Verticillium dahliae VdLs.17]EGY13330.1 pre-mRNA-splicing factor prp1 [Verticillium dahliae VdLs.17]
MASRRDFLSQPAPENYIAGIGRGATGFTTRSDLGPAREGPSEDQIKEAVAKRAAQLGIGGDGKKGDDKDDDKGGDDDRFKDPDNEVGLFAGGLYDKDDEEADRIWQEVDDRWAGGGRSSGGARAVQEEYERNNPKSPAVATGPRRGPGPITDDEDEPNSPGGWIAGARLEELAGKTVAARNVIARGCEKCPKNVDVWLENIRLNDVRNAKIIAAEAIKKNDKSVLLWVEAMRLENEPRAKKRVIRLALDHIPDSEALWKEAVNLEEDQTDARLLLAKATEIIPLSVDLWLALARLETPENAQKVLNKARRAVPTSFEIWIAAARLQEQLGASVNVMKRAVNVLVKESAMPKREEWIAEAEKCEEEGAVATCGDIIKETLGWGLDEDDDRKDTWMDDARGSINRGMYETARAIYSYALRVFVNSRTLWMAAADLERNHGTRASLCQVLDKAVDACPKSESVVFERVLGHTDAALDLVQQALQYFPAAAKLWMLKGQIYEDLDKLGQAREAYSTGVKAVPASVPLWLLYARLEERAGLVVKARSVLDRARLAVPRSPALWCESVRVERRAGNVNQAKSLMAKALQEVPKSGLLWSEQIWHLEPRTQRKPRSLEAIKKVDNDPILFVAVARLFWGERKLEKAQNWFEKALVLDSNNGDTWAWYYKFLLQHGTDEKRGEVITKCVLVEPRHGEYWQAIAKRPANARKGTEEILNLVANSLER